MLWINHLSNFEKILAFKPDRKKDGFRKTLFKNLNKFLKILAPDSGTSAPLNSIIFNLPDISFWVDLIFAEHSRYWLTIVLSNGDIIKTGTRTAEMVKYFTNCFLASKVTFANQMYDICKASEIDYDKVCEYALYDVRIGKSHLAVPGPDGDRGFGGHCFPKDLAAMVYFAQQNDVNPDFLNQVTESNDLYRSEKDWLSMKGRAVSED